MRFTAVNIEGKHVEGVGVCKCYENFDNWNSKNCNEYWIRSFGKDNLSYLFIDTIEWVDGKEFSASNFELVFTKSIKVEL
jgi:hypothetical protein